MLVITVQSKVLIRVFPAVIAARGLCGLVRFGAFQRGLSSNWVVFDIKFHTDTDTDTDSHTDTTKQEDAWSCGNCAISLP